MNSKIISLYKNKLSEINKLSQTRKLVLTNRNNNSCTNTLSTRCSLSQKVKENVLGSFID